MSNRLYVVLYAIVLTLIIIGCSEDQVFYNQSNDNEISLRSSNDIQVDANLLHFESMEVFNNHLLNLRNLDRNELSRELSYEELGLSTSKGNGDYYTRYPSAELFNNQKGFTSMRELEEENIRTSMENDEEFFGLISDPYLKSVLNEDGAVSIECRIYFMDDLDIQVVIANRDMEAYEAVKNATDYYSMEVMPNVRIYNEKTQHLYFNRMTDYGIPQLREVKEISFIEVPDESNGVHFKNVSFIDNNCEELCFTFEYPDGSISQGLEPNRPILPGERVIVKLGCGPVGPPDPPVPPVISDTLEPRGFCDIGGGPINDPGPFSRILAMFDYDEGNCTFTPDFDGAWENPVIQWSFSIPAMGINSGILPPNSGTIVNPFRDQGLVVEICHWVEPWNPTPCCGFFSIPPCCGEDEECEIFASSFDQWEILFGNGELWRLDVDGAVKRDGFGPSSWPGEVAARMVIFQRRNGSWEDTCPDEGKIDMWGTYVDQDENCREYSVDNVDRLHPHRTDCDENQQAWLDHNGARVLTQCDNTIGSLVSEFAIRVDGEWREYRNGQPLIVY